MSAKAAKKRVTKEQAAEKPPTEKPEATNADAKEGRDAKGALRQGQSRRPGNPFARECAFLRTTLIFTTTAVDIVRAADALKKKAFEGGRFADAPSPNGPNGGWGAKAGQVSGH